MAGKARINFFDGRVSRRLEIANDALQIGLLHPGDCLETDASLKMCRGKGRPDL